MNSAIRAPLMRIGGEVTQSRMHNGLSSKQNCQNSGLIRMVILSSPMLHFELHSRGVDYEYCPTNKNNPSCYCVMHGMNRSLQGCTWKMIVDHAEAYLVGHQIC